MRRIQFHQSHLLAMQSVATQGLCPKAFRWLYEGLPWLPVSRLLSLLTRSPLWRCWHRKWHPNRWQCQQCMRHMQPAQIVEWRRLSERVVCTCHYENMWHLKASFQRLLCTLIMQCIFLRLILLTLSINLPTTAVYGVETSIRVIRVTVNFSFASCCKVLPLKAVMGDT